MAGRGSLAFAGDYAAAMAAAATDAFDQAFADATRTSAVRFMRELIPYMVSRRR